MSKRIVFYIQDCTETCSQSISSVQRFPASYKYKYDFELWRCEALNDKQGFPSLTFPLPQQAYIRCQTVTKRSNLRSTLLTTTCMPRAYSSVVTPVALERLVRIFLLPFLDSISLKQWPRANLNMLNSLKLMTHVCRTVGLLSVLTEKLSKSK